MLKRDFNIDLIKYSSETNAGDFYDLLCSSRFRPLILQATGVTSKSATLIDNIFINDMTCHSQGGNLTSFISYRYDTTERNDLSQNTSNKKRSKFARDFRTFNNLEMNYPKLTQRLL